MSEFQIAGRQIGLEHPPYIIAEMSANHAGSFEEAAELVRIAASAGVDAVKLQTYTADTMTIDVESDLMVIGEGSLWEGRSLHELYEEAHTPWEWQPELRRLALSHGVELFSSAFDVTAVEFLEAMDVPAHKVASFEVVDLELIAAMASTGKPLIISDRNVDDGGSRRGIRDRSVEWRKPDRAPEVHQWIPSGPEGHESGRDSDDARAFRM